MLLRSRVYGSEIAAYGLGFGTKKLPNGSKYPNSRVFEVHTLNGFWTLKPYYLGTWILRVVVQASGFRG